MRFAFQTWSMLFILLPLMGIIYLICARRMQQHLQRFADDSVLKTIAPSPRSRRLKLLTEAILIMLLVSLLISALMRPQWGYSWKESQRKGVDLVFAVDVSTSMLAKDVLPSRLGRVKRKLVDLLGQLRGDRVGLVSFAGAAFIECPLTVDYNTFRLFVDALDPALVPVAGTDIHSALQMSLKLLQPSSEERSSRDGAIILLTDGETFGSSLENVARQAKEANIRIYVIGVGTPTGAPIEIDGSYKKDKQGQVVISKLDELALKELALQTGGIYVTSLTSDEDTKAIYDLGIKKILTDREMKGERAKRWNEYFQLPLLLALFLLLLELGYRWWPLKSKAKPVPPSLSAILLILISLIIYPSLSLAERSEVLGAKANAKFGSGDYQQALKDFSTATERAPADYRFLVGKGSALYRLGKFAEAEAAFREALTRSDEKTIKAALLYNTGNAQVQSKKFAEAIKSYEESISLNSNDQEAKDNLEYVKRLLQQQNEKQDKKQENKESQDKKQENEDKQQSSSEQEKKKEDTKDSLADKDQKNEEQEEQQQPSSPAEDKNDKEKSQAETEESDSSDGKNTPSEPEQTPADNKIPSSVTSASGESPPSMSTEQLDSLLANVQENREALRDYRLKQTEKKQVRRPPEQTEKDW